MNIGHKSTDGKVALKKAVDHKKNSKEIYCRDGEIEEMNHGERASEYESRTERIKQTTKKLLLINKGNAFGDKTTRAVMCVLASYLRVYSSSFQFGS